jgi:hypothetical protein
MVLLLLLDMTDNGLLKLQKNILLLLKMVLLLLLNGW